MEPILISDDESAQDSSAGAAAGANTSAEGPVEQAEPIAPAPQGGWAVLALDHGNEPKVQKGGHVNIYCYCSGLREEETARDWIMVLRQVDRATKRAGYAYAAVHTSALPARITITVKAQRGHLRRLPASAGAPGAARVQLTLELPADLPLGVDDLAFTDASLTFGEQVLVPLRKKLQRLRRDPATSAAADEALAEFQRISGAYRRAEATIRGMMEADERCVIRRIVPVRVEPAIAAVAAEDE